MGNADRVMPSVSDTLAAEMYKQNGLCGPYILGEDFMIAVLNRIVQLEKALAAKPGDTIVQLPPSTTDSITRRYTMDENTTAEEVAKEVAEHRWSMEYMAQEITNQVMESFAGIIQAAVEKALNSIPDGVEITR